MKTESRIQDLITSSERQLVDTFSRVDEIAYSNQQRVLSGFRDCKVTEEYFGSTTGYGLDDAGREALDQVFATVFEAEAACVRLQFVSGTHALACAILGNLSPGRDFFALTGTPYDSLEPVVRSDEAGSLARMGSEYREVDLNPADSTVSELLEELSNAVPQRVTGSIYYIQKSRGYSYDRKSYSQEEISRLIKAVRKFDSNALVIVDNCYGEFVETSEPIAVGADLVAGSLIKNPGGGLAITGGYIAGRRAPVEAAANRLTAPGIGRHMGLTFDQARLVFQGLFMAPSVVAGAVKGAHLFALVFKELGFEVNPLPFEERYDIIQAILLESEQRLINFARAMQRLSPVDAHVVPEPAVMPGYSDRVIMAGGTFVDGATIELSCDGPLRSPYAAFVQGGLSYHHIRCCLAGVLADCQSGKQLTFL